MQLLIRARQLAIWRIEMLRSRLNFIVNDIFLLLSTTFRCSNSECKRKIIEQINGASHPDLRMKAI